MHIMIILGSSREGRQGGTVAEWVVESLRQRTDISIDYVDTRELQLPFFDELAPPSDLAGDFRHAEAAAWNERVARADGFIIITPEYNHGIPAILKNAIDYAWEGWNYKPFSLISYSNGLIAGARAMEQLRLVIQGVWGFPLFRTVMIPKVQDAFDQQGQPVSERTEASLAKLVDELIRIGGKLKS